MFDARTLGQKWYEKPDYVTECIETAMVLLERYSHTRFFSLGQSPAWITRAMELVADDQDRHQNIEVGYIPFSGKFYQAQEGLCGMPSSVAIFVSSMKGRPSHENGYRQVLTKLALDPKSIIKKADEGTQTIIAECVNQGAGLASFLSVLCLWARELNCEEALKKSLRIVLIHYKYHPVLEVLCLPEENMGIVIDDARPVSSCMIFAMANGIDAGVLSDRLVPEYPYWMWDNPPQLSESHRANIESIEAKLKHALVERKTRSVSIPTKSGFFMSSFKGFLWAAVEVAARVEEVPSESSNILESIYPGHTFI